MTVVRRRFLLISLTALIWFAALARGAQDLWAVTALCGWLSLITSLWLYTRYLERQKILLPLVWPLTALFCGILISSRHSLDINTTHLEIESLACVFISFFLFSNLFEDRKKRRAVIRGAGSVIFPLTALAVWQYFRDIHAMSWDLHNSRFLIPSHWSASSSFSNSALFAGFSLSWMILAWHHRKEGRYYHWLFVACTLNLFLSRSWWALISLPIGFTSYYKNARPKKMQILFLSVSCMMILLAWIVKFGPGRDPAYTPDARLGWWAAGLRMFLQHPWVGVGLGAYGTAFPFYKPIVAQNTLYAHSFPIEVLAELGVMGLVGILLVAGFCWRNLSAENIKSHEDQACRATLLMLLCFSLTTIFMDYFIAKLIVMLFLAMSLPSKSLKRYSMSPIGISWVMLTILFLIPIWYRPFCSSQLDALGLKQAANQDLTEAERSFRRALILNPYEDDSCRGLARLYQVQFEKSHSMLDLGTSLAWANEALRLKQVPISYSEKTQ